MALGKALHNARLKKKLTASEVAAATRMRVQIVEDIEREDFSRIAASIYGKGFIRLYAEHVGLDPKPLVHEYVSRFVLSRSHSMTRGNQVRIEEKLRLGADTTAVSDAGISAKVRPTLTAKAAETTRQDEPDLFSIAGLSDAAPISQGPGTKTEEKQGRVERAGEKLKSPEEPVRPADSAKKFFSEARSAAEKTIRKTAELWKKFAETLPEKVKTITGGFKKHGLNLREVIFAASPLRSISVILGVLIVLVFVISCLYRCVKRVEPETVLPLPETKERLRLGEEPPPPSFE